MQEKFSKNCENIKPENIYAKIYIYTQIKYYTYHNYYMFTTYHKKTKNDLMGLSQVGIMFKNQPI